MSSHRVGWFASDSARAGLAGDGRSWRRGWQAYRCVVDHIAGAWITSWITSLCSGQCARGLRSTSKPHLLNSWRRGDWNVA
eukprot:1734209-Prymnesium_polylepis.1